MKRKLKITFFILLGLAVILGCFLLLEGRNIAVMNPKGWVGLKQRDLLITSTWLMLIVIIPTSILAYWVAWKYREGNGKSKYQPNWDYNFLAEAIWWGIPCIIIAILSVLVWRSSHQLDPFKPLDSPKKPLVIQVVALQWKWFFIYPEQNIATVSYIRFPKDTPITFDITADAPMNSFWIPQLGGQIYAMPGMKTKLHLIANEEGSFRGASANLSGRGFSGMTFVAEATSEEDFESWVQSVQSSSSGMGLAEYNQLALPSENNPPAFYSLQDSDLYDQIVMKYMVPMEGN